MDINYALLLIKKFINEKLPNLLLIIIPIFLLLFLRFILKLPELLNNIIEILLLLLVLTLGLYLSSITKAIKKIRSVEEISSLPAVKFYKTLRLKKIITDSRSIIKELENIVPYFFQDYGIIDKHVEVTREKIKNDFVYLFHLLKKWEVIVFLLFSGLASFVLYQGDKHMLNFYFLIFILTLIGGILSSMVGFASKTLAISILILFIDIKTAIVLTAAYSIVLYATSSFVFKENIDKMLLFIMSLFLIPGLIIGLIIFKHIDLTNLKVIFSILILFFVIFKLTKKEFDFDLNNLKLGILVFFYGIVAGATGVAGPLLAMLLFQYGLKKNNFIGFSSALLLIEGITLTVGYSLMGYLHVENTVLLVIVLVSAISSAIIGRRLIQFIPQRAFDLLLLVVLFGLGVYGLV